MTNKEIMDIAMQQSAYYTNAKVSDFLQDTNVFVKSGVGPLARKYYKEPIACNFVSYGSNVVASVKDEFKEIVETYLSKFEFYHCFETPNMHWLDERMKEKGYRVCFMAEYFLPDMERLKRLECNYVLKVLEQKDFADLYLPMWGNAFFTDLRFDHAQQKNGTLPLSIISIARLLVSDEAIPILRYSGKTSTPICHILSQSAEHAARPTSLVDEMNK